MKFDHQKVVEVGTVTKTLDLFQFMDTTHLFSF